MNRAAAQRIDGDDMPERTIKSIGGETLAADIRDIAPAAAQTGAIAIPENLIARRAYELWLDRGCPEGTPDEDWYKAESELTSVGQAAVAVPQPPLAAETAGPPDARTSLEGPRPTAGRQRSPANDLVRRHA
jgi:hypothetical protein